MRWGRIRFSPTPPRRDMRILAIALFDKKEKKIEKTLIIAIFTIIIIIIININPIIIIIIIDGSAPI